MKYFLLAIFLIGLQKIYSQELTCCTSIPEVKDHLNGEWKKRGGDPNKIYSFNFREDQGEAKIFLFMTDGTKKMVMGSESAVSVVQKTDGFNLIYDWKHSLIEQHIVFLNKENLTLALDSQKTVQLYKVNSSNQETKVDTPD